MHSTLKDRADVADGIRGCFPGSGDTILGLAALVYMEDGPLSAEGSGFDRLMRQEELPDLSDEAVSRALSELTAGFCLPVGNLLALDYSAPYTEHVGFGVHDLEEDIRPFMDAVLLVDSEDGSPRGLLPLPEFSGIGDVCEALRTFDGVLVTDRMEYDRATVQTLDRWGTDWLLTQPPFPQSASDVRGRMDVLKHGDIEYETCKARYDKHWLFRFYDPAEKEREVRIISERIKDRREANRLIKTAGITDAVSSQSFDIRRVRSYMDIRERCDAEMRLQWHRMDGASPKDRPTAFATLCLQIIAGML